MLLQVLSHRLARPHLPTALLEDVFDAKQKSTLPVPNPGLPACDASRTWPMTLSAAGSLALHAQGALRTRSVQSLRSRATGSAWASSSQTSRPHLQRISQRKVRS